MTRREWLRLLFLGLALGEAPLACSRGSRAGLSAGTEKPVRVPRKDKEMLFLAGDVMTGRGIDQILPHPSMPTLYEGYMRSAIGYVELAEQANGPIPRKVSYDYVWGDALAELEALAPVARIINLETAVTDSDRPEPKGINYRMHPDNVGCLSAAGIDCCVLANNHVLDWGRPGLDQTLRVLRAAGLQTCGAGLDAEAALRPAVIDGAGETRVLVFAYGSPSSGVPKSWVATRQQSGVNLLADYSDAAVDAIASHVDGVIRPGDIVIVSLHWGDNWGFEVSPEQQRFARQLIDRAGADIVHGHSSHHPRPIEVYADRLILYGCGDLLNDYEGISGYEEFRGDLALMYFPMLDRVTGRLSGLRMTPMQMHRFQLRRASQEDARWLQQTLNRQSGRFGVGISLAGDGSLTLA